MRVYVRRTIDFCQESTTCFWLQGRCLMARFFVGGGSRFSSIWDEIPEVKRMVFRAVHSGIAFYFDVRPL